MSELGRMPTATEIDACPKLPSARQIQRRFGGIVNVRKELGYKDTDLGSGDNRSKVGRQVNADGLALESRLLKELRSIFGEIAVHEQRRFGPTKQALDFYVYTQSGNFAVDVFVAKNEHSLRVNAKMKRNNYIDYTGKLYLVYDCPMRIDSVEDRSVILLSVAEFLEEVKRYKPYDFNGAYF